jgi:outer membrane receptor protein involved in Fe transport
MAGLRTEFTRIDISDRANTFNNRKNYNRLFPSMSLSYLLQESTTIQLNYSRRISRPSLQLVYPFVELTNFNSQYIGNPDMDPAYTDAVQFNLLQHWPKLTFHPSIYYQQTKDFIFFYTSRDDKSGFITMPVNLDKETRYGLELSGTYDPLKWLQFTGEYNLYGFKQRGAYDSQNFDYSNVAWNMRIGARVKMPYGFTFQGRYNLVSAQNNAQSHTKSLYYVDLGLSKNLFKDKCAVVFDATNVFDTRKTRVKVTGENYIFNRVISNNAARYRLSVVYRFNSNSNQSERKEKATNRN